MPAISFGVVIAKKFLAKSGSRKANRVGTKSKFIEMKKYLFLGIMLSISMATMAQTEMSNWLVGGYRVNFLTPTPSVTTVSTPPINTPPFKGNNSWYDNTGALQFYIQDGKLYNKLHAALATLTTNSNVTHFGIAPIPGISSVCSDKYYIILNRGQSGSTGTVYAEYGTLDLNANNGAGSFSWNGTLLDIFSNPMPSVAAGSMAISPLTTTGTGTPVRYLYMYGAGQYIHVFEINSGGITTIQSTNAYYCANGAEMELTNNGTKLAFASTAGSNRGIRIVDCAGGMISSTIGFIPVQGGDIHGIEFDKSGDFLFYSTASPDAGIHMSSITSASWSISPIPGTSAFGYSMLEKSYDGNSIICSGGGQYKAIDAANWQDPTFGSLTSWSASSNSSFMPEQIDGEDILSRTVTLSGQVARCGAGGVGFTVSIPPTILALIDAVEISTLPSGPSAAYIPAATISYSTSISTTTSFEVKLYHSSRPNCYFSKGRTIQVLTCSSTPLIIFNVNPSSSPNMLTFKGQPANPAFEAANGIQSAWSVQELDPQSNSPLFTINDPACWHGGPEMTVNFDGFNASLDYTSSLSPFSCTTAAGLFAADRTYQVTRKAWGTGYGPYESTVIIDKGYIITEQLGKNAGQPATGIHETASGKNAFNIYPNPSKGLININAPDFKAEHVEVYNITGKKVYQRSNESGNDLSGIDLSELPEGIYTIKVSGGGKEEVQRIVLE
jgi:hypothetical protein